MQDRFLLILDEGTTSTRAMLYTQSGDLFDVSQAELTQYYPAPGWVEHDAEEIWQKTLTCARVMVARAGGADHIAALGITNQRETVVAWDRRSGQPVGRAIVWQDHRTEEACLALREAGREPEIRAKTGLMLDPYFSASKMRWLLDNRPEATALGSHLALGTVESWLVWKLTGGLHISDASNASRTMLLTLTGKSWDDDLLEIFGIARHLLPEIVDNSGHFGDTLPALLGAPIPICGLCGDQQAATIGQGCLAPGQVKATLGTGAFVLANTGSEVPKSHNRLLATILAQESGKRTYALEGSVFVAGNLLKWLRDQLGIIGIAAESESLAKSVPDNGGVCIVPAFSGLGAPYWRSDVRGIISGLSHGTGRAHIARAALEAMAHQLHDLKHAFGEDGVRWELLHIDGGMSANDWLAQDLADILDLRVERPQNIETTSLGVAMLTSVGCGMRASLAEASQMRKEASTFRPAMTPEDRQCRLDLWQSAIGRLLT